ACSLAMLRVSSHIFFPFRQDHLRRKKEEAGAGIQSPCPSGPQKIRPGAPSRREPEAIGLDQPRKQRKSSRPEKKLRDNTSAQELNRVWQGVFNVSYRGAPLSNPVAKPPELRSFMFDIQHILLYIEH